jgi:hypothetical protein
VKAWNQRLGRSRRSRRCVLKRFGVSAAKESAPHADTIADNSHALMGSMISIAVPLTCAGVGTTIRDEAVVASLVFDAD